MTLCQLATLHEISRDVVEADLARE
jgi:hypothetical protein